ACHVPLVEVGSLLHPESSRSDGPARRTIGQQGSPRSRGQRIPHPHGMRLVVLEKYLLDRNRTGGNLRDSRPDGYLQGVHAGNDVLRLYFRWTDHVGHKGHRHQKDEGNDYCFEYAFHEIPHHGSPVRKLNLGLVPEFCNPPCAVEILGGPALLLSITCMALVSSRSKTGEGVFSNPGAHRTAKVLTMASQ